MSALLIHCTLPPLFIQYVEYTACEQKMEGEMRYKALSDHNGFNNHNTRNVSRPYHRDIHQRQFSQILHSSLLLTFLETSCLTSGESKTVRFSSKDIIEDRKSIHSLH
jgi:hypothetical protein